MKILRSDLELGMNKKLFEVSSQDLPEKGINFLDDRIICNLSSVKFMKYFKLYGNLKVKLKLECDRCLNSFNENYDLKINFLVSPSDKRDEKYESEIIFLPEKNDYIDISDLISDMIILEKPIKSLCLNNCKGLCNQCGKNLNHVNCSCKFDLKNNNMFKALKKLKLN
tara:strand:- start:8876 stop:9379 length:504 start_codon:yes stop_codon:yes gene_type:complete